MTKVRVKYSRLVRGGSSTVHNFEEEVCLLGTATVRKLLETLTNKYGSGFKDALVTPEWQLLSPTLLTLNGRDIRTIGGLDAELKDNSQVSITVLFVPVGGG